MALYAYEYPLDVTCVINLIPFAFKQSGRRIKYVLEMHVAQPGEQSQAYVLYTAPGDRTELKRLKYVCTYACKHVLKTLVYFKFHPISLHIQCTFFFS